MKIGAAFPSAYLKAADLQGRKCMVTMRQISMEEIGGEHKPVLLFDGTDKGLILNKTNANIIAEMHGEETDDWLGKKIVLYPARVEFSGKIVDAIRVELQQRALSSQAPLAPTRTPSAPALAPIAVNGNPHPFPGDAPLQPAPVGDMVLDDRIPF